jgi:hypothetical protein
MSPTGREAWRRVLGMAAVWLVFGAAVGVLTAPKPDAIGVVAGVIAGVVVLLPLGLVLTCVGGRGRDSTAGGLLGLIVVPAVWHLAALPLPPAWAAPFGLLFGGIVGATAVGVFYRLPRLVLCAARTRHADAGDLQKPVSV